jgi:predicted permease
MNDFRYALRQLGRTPAFTLAAILSLTLGIGATATIFNLVNGMLLRPPPGERPEELIRVYTTHPGGFQYGSLSYPDYLDLREATEALGDLTLFRPVPLALGDGAAGERIWGQMVTSNFFGVLGVRPVLGRGFVPAEDEPGAPPVVVLAHHFWARHFGEDPEAVGRTVFVNGSAFTVVGVAPEGFRGMQHGLDAELFAPMGMAGILRPGVDVREARGSRSFLATGRLAPGVTAEGASRALSLVMTRLGELYPATNQNRGMLAIPESEVGWSPDLRGTTVAAAVLFMSAGVLLLLLAAVNVSTLLLARARARRREMGVRVALGASAGRLFRQNLVESLMLAALAGGLGLLVTFQVSALLARVRLPLDVPLVLDFPVDLRVVLATLGVATVIAVVFGSIPTFQAARAGAMASLRGGGGAGGARDGRLGRGLVVVQVALSLALLVGAGFFARTAWEAGRQDPGFELDGHLLVSLDVGLHGYDEARGTAFYASLVERVRSLPDVRAASLAELLPVGLTGQQWGVTVEGYTPAEHEDMIVGYNVVGPDYFRALGTTVVAGRDFDGRDRADAAPVAIVSEAMARRYWPDGSALGGRVHVAGALREVVGVVPSLQLDFLDPTPRPFVWVPHAQFYNAAMVVHVRTAGELGGAVTGIRRAVAALDPTLPVLEVRTMAEHAGVGLLPLRAGSLIFAIFGAAGLLLAAVGLYGVLAFQVARRTREIGVRMALGATGGRVVGQVLRQGTILVGLGLGLGLPVAFAVSLGATRVLHGASAADPVVYVAVTAVLLLTALLAAWLPARRAARIHPMEALRHE